MKARMRGEEEKALAARSKRHAAARRQKARVEEQRMEFKSPEACGFGFGKTGAGNKAMSMSPSPHHGSSRSERIFQEAAARNQVGQLYTLKVAGLNPSEPEM